MQKALFQLESLSCPGCGKKIEDHLKKHKGIRSMQVLSKLCRVRTEFNETEMNAEDIETMIHQLGYVVKLIKIVERENEV